MKFATMITVMGAVVMLLLFSMNTAHAENTVASTAISADQQDAAEANTADLPGPASWAMLIVGFGTIGGVVRRGRAQRRLAAHSPS